MPPGQVWTSLNKSGQVWTSLNKSEQVWTSLNKSEQVWTSLDKSGRLLLINAADVINENYLTSVPPLLTALTGTE